MSGSDTLAIHAAHPSGAPGVLLLLWRPDPSGRVSFREWSSDDWLAPGREGVAEARELRERIQSWIERGWKFSAAPSHVEQWLDARQ
ncbi:hypothetical protein BH23GEM5_BH23GEM5_13430 [soil metagenome]